jgi:hypothetical protein
MKLHRIATGSLTGMDRASLAGRYVDDPRRRQLRDLADGESAVNAGAGAGKEADHAGEIRVNVKENTRAAPIAQPVTMPAIIFPRSIFRFSQSTFGPSPVRPLAAPDRI